MVCLPRCGADLGKRTLLVVSTDLSHYLDYAAAERRDLATAGTIERLDCTTLGPHDACGFSALNGALCAASRCSWTVTRLDLRNSGDTSGEKRCDELAKAVRHMEELKVRRFPVINKSKRMVGILSLGDVSSSAPSDLLSEIVKSVSAHHTEKQGIEDDAGRHARRNNQAPVW
jgi:hypothetical protein